MKNKIKLTGLRLFGWMVSLAPVGTYVGMNWEQFAPTTFEGVKVGAGLTVVAVFTVLISLRKANLPKGVTGWIVATAIVWLLQAVLTDIMALMVWATSGVMADSFLIEPFATNLELQIERDKQAKTTADAVEGVVEKVVDKVLGSRV